MIGISNGEKDLADTNYILKDVSTFCHPKGGAQLCRNRRCGRKPSDNQRHRERITGGTDAFGWLLNPHIQPQTK